MPGIYEMAANRSNGLIVYNYETKKKRFVPSRKHQFTPLESISIYTNTDTAALGDIFKTMLDKFETTPPPSTTSKGQELQDYFSSILPEYDRDRVYQSDIKKIIKWFLFLKEHDLLKEEEETVEEEKAEEAENKEEES